MVCFRYFSSRIFVNINSLTSSEIQLREEEIDFDLKMLRFIEAKYISTFCDRIFAIR